MLVTGNPIIDEDISEILSEPLEWSNFSGKSVLVTGANGMLPSYIVYTLLALNESVLKDNPCAIIALVRDKEKAMLKFKHFASRSDFKLIVSDVSCFEEYDGNIDIIIHAASQASPRFYGTDPVGTLRANTVGTLNLLELARKKVLKKFLYVSSGEVYGVQDGIGSSPIVDESCKGNVDCTNVRSCYAESKRMGETMCVCYAHQYGLHMNMVRLAHTYGPGCALDDGRVFADFVRNIVQNKNIKVNSDGSARRCFMYVTDMIKGLFYVLLKGKNAEAYNISSMTETSIKDLANMLCALYPEKNLHSEFLPLKDDNSYMRSKVQGMVMDNSKLRSLGWEESVPVKTGFRRMIDSYMLS